MSLNNDTSSKPSGCGGDTAPEQRLSPMRPPLSLTSGTTTSGDGSGSGSGVVSPRWQVLHNHLRATKSVKAVRDGVGMGRRFGGGGGDRKGSSRDRSPKRSVSVASCPPPSIMFNNNYHHHHHHSVKQQLHIRKKNSPAELRSPTAATTGAVMSAAGNVGGGVNYSTFFVPPPHGAMGNKRNLRFSDLTNPEMLKTIKEKRGMVELPSPTSLTTPAEKATGSQQSNGGFRPSLIRSSTPIEKDPSDGIGIGRQSTGSTALIRRSASVGRNAAAVHAVNTTTHHVHAPVTMSASEGQQLMVGTTQDSLLEDPVAQLKRSLSSTPPAFVPPAAHDRWSHGGAPNKKDSMVILRMNSMALPPPYHSRYGKTSLSSSSSSRKTSSPSRLMTQQFSVQSSFGDSCAANNATNNPLLSPDSAAPLPVIDDCKNNGRADCVVFNRRQTQES